MFINIKVLMCFVFGKIYHTFNMNHQLFSKIKWDRLLTCGLFLIKLKKLVE